MVKATKTEANPPIPRSESPESTKATRISTATQAANKALSSPAESSPTTTTTLSQDTSNLQLPSVFQNVANGVTELLAIAMELTNVTENMGEIPERTKLMSPYELKSWVDNIVAILKQSQSLVDISLHSILELKEQLEESSGGGKTPFITSILDLFKTGKK